MISLAHQAAWPEMLPFHVGRVSMPGGLQMKKLVIASIAVAAVYGAPAIAADMPLKAPAPPIWTWTGFYVGVEAGAGWDSTRWTGADGSTTGQFQGNGGEVGATLGWNWQAPGSPWVIGIEGDWSWDNLRAVTGPASKALVQGVNWLATLRGRMGYANGPLLFYVTGGAAFADIHNFFSPLEAATGGNYTTTATGWAVGGGLEGALGGGWSLKGEYIYTSFGATTACVAGDANCTVAVAINANYTNIHLVRAGVNYKF